MIISHQQVVVQPLLCDTMISKVFVVLSCVLLAVIAEEKYSDKYDNVNYVEILENERLRHGYGNCLLDKGKCTPEGKELREKMQDALETGCKKCTDQQLEGTKTVINYLIKHDHPLWKELTAKYDPEGIWRQKYEGFAKEKGIEIPKD
ncbi:ejaculatory bulb-specific protein 3-like [Pararge aegeria]|uniref:Jg6678 protein n=1 Tax=Pararge aegeria aegeria TaxID=348720 RepID=A0A8S4SD22_9NEOP|nr:ejaculatory bulb-specific protein 3-like [Pararge aegeria]CAH2266978.1 jg6678 [Pararge aegeria aegeria]